MMSPHDGEIEGIVRKESHAHLVLSAGQDVLDRREKDEYARGADLFRHHHMSDELTRLYGVLFQVADGRSCLHLKHGSGLDDH